MSTTAILTERDTTSHLAALNPMMVAAVSYNMYKKKKEEKRVLLVPLLKCHIDLFTQIHMNRNDDNKQREYTFNFHPITVHQLNSTFKDFFPEKEAKDLVHTFPIQKSMLEHQAITIIKSNTVMTHLQVFACTRLSNKPDHGKTTGVIWHTYIHNTCQDHNNTTDSVTNFFNQMRPKDETSSILTTKSHAARNCKKANSDRNEEFWFAPEDMDATGFIIAFIGNKNFGNIQTSSTKGIDSPSPLGLTIQYSIFKHDNGIIQGSCTFSTHSFNFARKVLCEPMSPA